MPIYNKFVENINIFQLAHVPFLKVSFLEVIEII